MSVLHWHVTDTESFPLVLSSVPDVTTYGRYSEDE
jgi:hypothetical protein